MTLARETVLAALDLVLKTALVAMTPPVEYLDRNSGIESKVEEDQEVTVSGDARIFACLKDGDALEPEPLLGRDLWDHTQGPVLELAVIHPDAPTRDAAYDAALVVIDTALKSDPTLGGTCNYLQVQPPEPSTIGDAAAPMGKAAEIGIEVLYQSDSSIG